jgi:ATP-dependent Clp protease, protease subunit
VYKAKAARADRPRLPEIRNAVLAALPVRQQNKQPKGEKFWQFKSLAAGEGELMLYGEIADMTWWGDEVTSKQFLQDLKNLGDIQNLTVRINSPGGDVFAAQAIYTNLKEHKAKVTVKIDGIAASAATIVAMAGDTILIEEGAYMMIHNPSTMLFGSYNADDIDKMSDMLGVIKEGMITNYTKRTGLDRKAVSKIMDAATWYTGQEAIDAGFADKLMMEDQNNQSDQNAAVVDGNQLIIRGVGFDMDMLPPRAVASFSAQAERKPGSDTPPPAKNENKEEHHTMTLEELRAQHPDLVSQVEQTATATATANERKRIQSIDELANTVDAALIAEAKYTTPATAEAVAMRAVKEGKFLNTAYVVGTKADANDGANKVQGAAADQANGKTEKTAKDKAEIDHAGDIAKKAMAGYNPRR